MVITPPWLDVLQKRLGKTIPRVEYASNLIFFSHIDSLSIFCFFTVKSPWISFSRKMLLKRAKETGHSSLWPGYKVSSCDPLTVYEGSIKPLNG